MDNLNKRKTKTSMSRRQKQIIQILVQMEGKPVTVSAIAERLKVSSRTILRELPQIDDWMDENDFRFSRKTGVGLLIDESPENLELIRDLLTLEQTSMVLGKEERRRRLLGELLFNTEPVKAFSFTSSYGISEGTLFGDLDYLEQWLEGQQVKLVRRQGVGIYIQGEERTIRQTIVKAVFDLYDMNQIMSLLPLGRGNDGYEEEESTDLELPPLLVFLTGRERYLASKVLEEFRQTMEVRFRDSALVGLYIRIALAIYRVRTGRMIIKPSPDWENLKSLKEYETVSNVQKKLSESYHLEFNESEVLDLTEHLSSARIWTDASEYSDPVLSVNIRQFVTSLLGIVENITGIEFTDNRDLTDDLVKHFSSVIGENKRDMFPAYSQIEPIKKEYPEIFDAVDTAMKMLDDSIHGASAASEDIGFVAMHFAAAADQMMLEKEKVPVVVVCPLGVGASRMLASSMNRSIHNIDIRRTVSAFEINAEELREEGVELIVSTAELNTDFPYICVGKVLRPQDRILLQNRIDEINASRISRNSRKRQMKQTAAGMNGIRRMAEISQEIIELIDHFRILQLMGTEDFSSLQEQAALLFAQDDQEKTEFLEGFRSREKISSTYIGEMKISLLHCKSAAAQHSRFGYIRLEQPLQTDEGEISGCVVMIAPSRLSKEGLEPVGRLSALLIEEPRFLQALQMGDTSAGIACAEDALVKYYNFIK